jgi:pimeloyl-ACP methyl ester carboxylesterase
LTDKVRETREGEVTGWSVNRERTLITFKESGGFERLSCWRLGLSGTVAGQTWAWMLTGDQPGNWNILGWASPNKLVLWRRGDSHCELQIIDIVEGRPGSVRINVFGRPVECRVTRSGRTEVLVTVSNGGRAFLCMHYPDADSYLVFKGAGGFNGLAAWDPERRILAVNVDSKRSPGVQLYAYDGRGYNEIDISWPEGIRPVSASGYDCSILGLTGIDCVGNSIPGTLDMSRRAVKWFGAHLGYSCVELGPSNKHMLTAAWMDAEYTYRVLDITGKQSGNVHPNSGVATNLYFSGDEQHLIGWYQSPTTPPDVICWNVESGEARPVGRRNGRETPRDMRWALRWTRDIDGRELPEWVFKPVRGWNGGTVLFLHGGPRSRLNQIYDPVIAALVGAGWTVVGMNYPGSSGYGMEYSERTRGDWGGADATSIEWRVRSLHADVGDRPICLYGHSYGGYLALLVASAVPELLRGVVVWAPVTDLHELLRGSAGMQRRWLEEELGDLRFNAQQLWERSPISRVPALCSTRLLVGHGRQDERCPVEQSRRLVELLNGQSRAGGSVHYQEDSDSSHTPSNWRWWTDAVLAHFARVSSPLLLAEGGLDSALPKPSKKDDGYEWRTPR